MRTVSRVPLGLRGKAGGGARVTAGPKRPHLGVCPGPNIPLQGPKGDQSWVFIGRTDAKAETLILWPPDVKN